MADKLADFVVGIGVKGQNIALTEINKVKKAGAALAKQKPKVNFQNVRAEINARKQLDLIRRQTQATRGQTELAKIESQKMAQMSQRIQGAGQTGIGFANSAMTSGATGITSQLPLVGTLFGAAASAIESVGQEYIQGVTSSKNIQLVTANYSRAFQGAFADGMKKASGTGVFTGLVGKAFYSSLVDQGAKAETVMKAAPGLELLAKAQGVGSIDELMSRLQSGTLREGAGLTKADIVLLQSQSQLLNNRFTADVGAQMLTQSLQRLTPQMQKVAGTAGLSQLSKAAAAEQSLQDMERSYSAEAVGVYGKEGVSTMYATRRADRQVRAFAQPLSKFMSDAQVGLVKQSKRVADKIKKGDYLGAWTDAFMPGLGEAQEKAKSEGSGGGELPGKRMYRSDENAESAGPLSMGSINDDMARSGQAIADTLRQINNQLNITKAQLRRV